MWGYPSLFSGDNVNCFFFFPLLTPDFPRLHFWSKYWLMEMKMKGDGWLASTIIAVWLKNRRVLSFLMHSIYSDARLSRKSADRGIVYDALLVCQWETAKKEGYYGVEMCQNLLISSLHVGEAWWDDDRLKKSHRSVARGACRGISSVIDIKIFLLIFYEWLTQILLKILTWKLF